MCWTILLAACAFYAPRAMVPSTLSVGRGNRRSYRNVLSEAESDEQARIRELETQNAELREARIRELERQNEVFRQREEKTMAAKVAAEQAAAERAAAERAMMEQAAAEKAEADRVATERAVAEQEKLNKLGLSILIDLIGVATYLVPVVGEAGDLGWAPISAYLIFQLYGNGIISGLAFAEELLPGLDIIPTATIAWFLENTEFGQNLTGAAPAQSSPTPRGSTVDEGKGSMKRAEGSTIERDN